MTSTLYQWAETTGRTILKVEELVEEGAFYSAWVTYSSGSRVFRYRLSWGIAR